VLTSCCDMVSCFEVKSTERLAYGEHSIASATAATTTFALLIAACQLGYAKMNLTCTDEAVSAPAGGRLATTRGCPFSKAVEVLRWWCCDTLCSSSRCDNNTAYNTHQKPI
jgi:hypothetical protein